MVLQIASNDCKQASALYNTSHTARSTNRMMIGNLYGILSLPLFLCVCVCIVHADKFSVHSGFAERTSSRCAHIFGTYRVDLAF